jgi:hypothetical protein
MHNTPPSNSNIIRNTARRQLQLISFQTVSPGDRESATKLSFRQSFDEKNGLMARQETAFSLTRHLFLKSKQHLERLAASFRLQTIHLSSLKQGPGANRTFSARNIEHPAWGVAKYCQHARNATSNTNLIRNAARRKLQLISFQTVSPGDRELSKIQAQTRPSARGTSNIQLGALRDTADMHETPPSNTDVIRNAARRQLQLISFQTVPPGDRESATKLSFRQSFDEKNGLMARQETAFSLTRHLFLKSKQHLERHADSFRLQTIHLSSLKQDPVANRTFSARNIEHPAWGVAKYCQHARNATFETPISFETQLDASSN